MGNEFSEVTNDVNFLSTIDLATKAKRMGVSKFIFASSCENMPNTLIEAMTVGLPIACSDRGPMPEVLKDAGVYFNPDSPISIAKAIELYLNDEFLIINNATKANQLSVNYSWARCSNETFCFLREVNNIN